VQFSSTSNGIVREYRWRFGDGAESNEAHPQHIYKKKGIYDVTLTVTGDDGSTATEKKEKYITVHGFCPLTTSLNNESHIEVLYKVRDRLLPSLPGMMLISLYYRNAVELTRLLENNPYLQNRLREMVTNNIGIAEQWVAGKPAVISAEQVEEIVQFLEAVSASSSVRLRNDIDMFIAGLNDGYLLQEFYIQVE
jgi:PKD repeat protein